MSKNPPFNLQWRTEVGEGGILQKYIYQSGNNIIQSPLMLNMMIEYYITIILLKSRISPENLLYVPVSLSKTFLPYVETYVKDVLYKK